MVQDNTSQSYLLKEYESSNSLEKLSDIDLERSEFDHSKARSQSIKPFQYLIIALATIVSIYITITITILAASINKPFFYQDLMTVIFKPKDGFPLINHRNMNSFQLDQHHHPYHLNTDQTHVSIHSHNDYWRKVPLFEALKLGINSVEADVWHVPTLQNSHSKDQVETEPENDYIEDDLFVGHHKYSLSSYKTLKSLYLDHIERMLDRINAHSDFQNNGGYETKRGLFPQDPSRTLYLYIDFKNKPQQVFQILQNSLKPLMDKNFVTYYNETSESWYHGPLTIIVTGDYPYESIQNLVLKNVFIDAPLRYLKNQRSDQDSDDSEYERFSKDFPSTMSIFGSDSLHRITGSKKALNGSYGLDTNQLNSLKTVIDKTHKDGLKVRIWDTPSWPIDVRNVVWKQLLELGVDVLNVDDIVGATRVFGI